MNATNARKRRPRSFLGLLGMASVAALLVTGIGCEFDSYLDPSVVGRWETTPVVLPILDQLDVIDEPPAKAPGTSFPKAEDLIPEIAEYVIGPGDLITFTIFELMVQNVETVQTRRVDELGFIRLPVIGTLHIAGLTPSRLEKEMVKLLESKNIIKGGQVSVIVQEGRQKTYSVIGEPQVAGTGIGTYTIPHTNFRLLEAMALARGVPGRIKTIYIIRAPQMMASLPEVLAGRHLGNSILVEEADGSKPVQTTAAPATPEVAPTDLIDNLLRGIDMSIENVKAGRPHVPAELEMALNGQEPAAQWVHVDGKWVKLNATPMPSAPAPAPVASSSSDSNPLKSVTPPTTAEMAAMLAEARIIEVPYDKLLDGELKYNLVINPGDVIRVPAPVIGNVYIGGAISRPGTYVLPGDKDLTLKQLIFAAGNLAPIAIPERVDLIRRVGDDQEAIVRLNLRSIFAGTEPDFYLKPNDTINIGTNAFASPLAVIRNGFRTTYGFGFILDRNFDDKVFGFQQ